MMRPQLSQPVESTRTGSIITVLFDNGAIVEIPVPQP